MRGKTSCLVGHDIGWGENAVEQQELITEVNATIRDLAHSEFANDDYAVDLLCECGCLRRVTVLASVYDVMEGPVVADGHAALCEPRCAL
jgi:hypothetical protein